MMMKRGTEMISEQQCRNCVHRNTENALHCAKYDKEQKPKYVVFPKKECDFFESTDRMDLDIINDYEDRAYGGIFGLITGDILGVPVEFESREERDADPVKGLRAYGSHDQPFGTWSDDSSLMLCLIDAVNQGFSLNKLADNMISYYDEGGFTPAGEWFDIGIGTGTAIKMMKLGINPELCGGSDESDNGNGSLMRILPMAYLRDRYDARDFISLTENVSALTHRHARSKLACIFYAEFAAELLNGRRKTEAYDAAVDFIMKNCSNDYPKEFKNFSRIFDNQVSTLERSDIGSSGYVINTLEAALWVFFNNETYEDTVLAAVNLGNDTDTTAAAAGGLAGIYYGVSNIPDRWLQNMRKKDEIKKMAERFLNSTN